MANQVTEGWSIRGSYLFNTAALLSSAALFMASIVSGRILGYAVEWSLLALILSLSNLLGTRRESSSYVMTGASIVLMSIYTLHLCFNSTITSYITLSAAIVTASIFVISSKKDVGTLTLSLAVTLYVYLTVMNDADILPFSMAYIIVALLLSIPPIRITGKVHSITPGVAASLALIISPSSEVSELILIGLVLFLLYTIRSGATCPFRKEPFLFISGLLLQASVIILLLIELQSLHHTIIYWILGYLLAITSLTSPPFYSVSRGEGGL